MFPSGVLAVLLLAVVVEYSALITDCRDVKSLPYLKESLGWHPVFISFTTDSLHRVFSDQFHQTASCWTFGLEIRSGLLDLKVNTIEWFEMCGPALKRCKILYNDEKMIHPYFAGTPAVKVHENEDFVAVSICNNVTFADESSVIYFGLIVGSRQDPIEIYIGNMAYKELDFTKNLMNFMEPLKDYIALNNNKTNSFIFNRTLEECQNKCYGYTCKLPEKFCYSIIFTISAVSILIIILLVVVIHFYWYRKNIMRISPN